MFDSVSITALNSALDGLSLRQRVIANNVANLQTPGFQAGKVSFESALADAVASGSGAVTPTVAQSLEPTRTDGNNVNLDEETLSNVDTNLRYQLATEAVDGGKVDVNGARAKPAKLVGAGDEVQVRVGAQLYVVHVKDVAERRGSAERAHELYEETPESAAARAKASEQQRLAALSVEFDEGRPSKKDRRDIRKFRGW